MTPRVATATVVIVSFRTPSLDLSWVPRDAPVIIVHNDTSLAETGVAHSNVEHIRIAGNVGFGAAVNAALPRVGTQRVVLCNPDLVANAEHWTALTDAADNEVVAVPLLDGAAEPTSIVNAYPTPSSALLTAYRVGRVLPRGSCARALLTRCLGGWGREHVELGTTQGVALPLATHWASGAMLSVSTQRLRDVGGFDHGYFLYMEDVDLCRRLARLHPDMSVRIADVPPAMHAVGGSAVTRGERLTVDRHYLASIRRYVRRQSGLRWRALDVALVPRSLELALRARRRG